MNDEQIKVELDISLLSDTKQPPKPQIVLSETLLQAIYENIIVKNAIEPKKKIKPKKVKTYSEFVCDKPLQKIKPKIIKSQKPNKITKAQIKATEKAIKQWHRQNGHTWLEHYYMARQYYFELGKDFTEMKIKRRANRTFKEEQAELNKNK